jgi:signal transduction histidine kinase
MGNQDLKTSDDKVEVTVKTHLGKLLLKEVLTIYFLLTILVTIIQVVVEFSSTRSLIIEELERSFNSIHSPLALALWGLEESQIQQISKGISSLPVVSYFAVWDELSDEPLAEFGEIGIKNLPETYGPIKEGSQFGLYVQLFFKHESDHTPVGRALIISGQDRVISRLEVGIIMLIINAMIKSALLIVLFLMVFRRRLGAPLEWLITRIKATHFEELITIREHENKELFELNTELTVLARTYNDLIMRLQSAHDTIHRQNQSLAAEVEEKTKHLSSALRDVEEKKIEMEQSNQLLSREISIRRQAQDELLKINETLESSLKQLNETQKELIIAEKMAALGNLVAGVAHEINTPVGTSLTAVSHLKDTMIPVSEAFKSGALTKTQLGNFIEAAFESTEILDKCLNQAAALIRSFKMVAVDQSSEDVRAINLKNYVNDVVLSLKPRLKRTKHKVHIECDDNIELLCKPGMISQLLTNLIMNSLIHGFDDNVEGTISVNISEDTNFVYIQYSDNGKGVSKEHMEKLFEPFFTTKRGQGGSGLGTHIIFNIVTQSLNGSINVQGGLGEGLMYDISLPKAYDKIAHEHE